jgi:hypothetical protein
MLQAWGESTLTIFFAVVRLGDDALLCSFIWLRGIYSLGLKWIYYIEKTFHQKWWTMSSITNFLFSHFFLHRGEGDS